MATVEGEHFGWPGPLRPQGGEAVGGLDGAFAGRDHGPLAHDAERLVPTRQGRDALIDAVERDQGAGSHLEPPVALVRGAERGGGVPIERLEIVQQVLVVALHRHDVVRSLLDDEAGGLGAAM